MAEYEPSREIDVWRMPATDYLAAEVQNFEAKEHAWVFRKVQERLASLGISKNRNSLFSAFIDGAWLRVLSMPQPLRDKVGDTETKELSGQRIIVNHDSLDVLTDCRKSVVHDYLLCDKYATMLELNSEVMLHIRDDQHVWDMHAGCGPLIIAKGGEVEVHQGTFYEEFEFYSARLAYNNLSASKHLLETLRVLTPSAEDTVTDVQIIRHP